MAPKRSRKKLNGSTDDNCEKSSITTPTPSLMNASFMDKRSNQTIDFHVIQ